MAYINAGDWDNCRYNYHTDDNNVATTTQFCKTCGGWVSGPIWMVNPRLCECIKYKTIKYIDPAIFPQDLFSTDYLAKDNEILALRKEIKHLEREIELLKELLTELKNKAGKPTK